MDWEKRQSPRAGDCYYQGRHPSGLTIFLYPKPEFSTAFAVFGTRFGSIDVCFQRSDEAQPQAVPEGVAHFLEHKLFESEEGDAFERYAKTGANANAFTNFENTSYLFSCTDRLTDSLEILLDFVQSPFFTEETVQKELGIISQEIKMYDDDPQWRVLFNYLRGMYHTHPIRQDIAGTVESIHQITPEILYRCYHTFYNLHNMALAVVGRFDEDQVMAVCDRLLKPCRPVQVRRFFQPEPEEVAAAYTEEWLPVALPLFQLGYKEPVTEEYRTVRDVAAVEILLETMASDASELFQRLLERDLINEASFSYEYFEGAGYATVMFGGESRDPHAVAQALEEEICRLTREGLPEEDFQRAKRSIYGENLAALNSTGSIANALVSMTFKGREIFAYLDALADMTLAECQAKLSLLRQDRRVLSVIWPQEEPEERME